MVSNDSMVPVDTNKYSVPVKYVEKKVKIKEVYGYKLEIYSEDMILIATHELVNGKDNVKKIDEHYEAIRTKAPKSIPEIKRQFISNFRLGNAYLDKTSKILIQQSYHVREFLKLREVYNIDDLNLVLEYCINNEIYRIEGIKEILKNKYFEIVIGEKDIADIANKITTTKLTSDDLIRETSYYEGGQN